MRGYRNQVGIGLSCRSARLHRLTELIPWNRLWAPSKFKNSGSGKELLLLNCFKGKQTYALVSVSVEFMGLFSTSETCFMLMNNFFFTFIALP